MTFTGAQVRAARTLLGWPHHRVAGEIAISLSEFASFEAGKSWLSRVQTSVLNRVLTAAGVEFEDDGRVRMGEGGP
jgi:hypothetical protein